MSELPPRSCAPCPHLGNYQKIAEAQGDYLEANTVPRPNLVHTGKVTLDDPNLGIPKTYLPPDIQAPIINPNEILPSTNEPAANKQPCTDSCCTDEKKKCVQIKCEDNLYTQAKKVDSLMNIEHPHMRMNVNTEESVKMLGRIPNVALMDSESMQSDVPVKGILRKQKPCPCEEKKQVNAAPAQAPPVAAAKKAPLHQKQETAENVANRMCYLPKPDDEFPEQREDEMGALGPWATGRVDWGPLAGLTGIRPVVDKYSVSRFSEGEWRTHNKEALDSLIGIQHQANLLEYNSKEAIETTRANTDKNQADSTRRLHQREQELHRWKCELERAITASSEEISIMLEQRRRLKQAMAVLQLPESIAGECLERRTGRPDSELVRDEVEEELIKEMALTAEIREQYTRTLADLEHQLLEDKTAKSRLEYDWSDKKQADEIECINVALNCHSNVLLFKPGAVGFPDHQSTQDQWEKFTRETLEESEITRQRSVALRGTLDAILTHGAKNLRAQADKVEMALAKRIACTEEIRSRLENELKTLLQRLADIETTVIELKTMIRRMDIPLKKVQTRLDNRIMYRPRIENCRDAAQYGLVDEAKTISDSVAALMSQLKTAEEVQNGLQMSRGRIELEIMIKRKTLEIDRDRIQTIRSYYPSATAMSGY